MVNVEEVALRLAAIQDELLALPAGPSPERFRLLQERDALRARAAQFALDADASRSTPELEAELESLQRRRRTLITKTTAYVLGDSADTAGRVGAAFVEANAGSAASSALDDLNRRISRIEDVLADRENAPA